VRSIIYAAPRTEIKELHAVRALLVDKFGKEVALASMEGEGVAERVERKLRVETPRTELVDAYLTEIARFYGVSFGEPEPSQDDDDHDDHDDEPSGGIAEENPNELEPALGADPNASRKEEEEKLAMATPPRKLGPQSPLRVVPPSPSTDNVAPKLKLPGAAAAKLHASKSDGKKPSAKKEDSLGKIPDVDELAKRFAALKR
jgi:vacuolar protein sorting-associated protein IST1